MARIRTVKPEFFSHEVLAGKSAHARLLAIGLLTLADCEGRLRWVPMQVHSQVFPWEASVNIESLLGELVSASYVVHYEADGKRYVEIVNFRKHQRLSGKELSYSSRIPPPPKKPNDLHGETGEALGKHPNASRGSVGNPLGTGEHRNIGSRNIGTEEEGCEGKHPNASQGSYSDEPKSKHLQNGGFLELWNKWKAKQAAGGTCLDVITESSQLYELENFETSEAIDILRFCLSRTNCKNLITNGDHKGKPAQPKSRGYETPAEKFDRIILR